MNKRRESEAFAGAPRAITTEQANEVGAKIRIARARKILESGLKYHENDGHDLPKHVVRLALEALGLQHKDQPGGTNLPLREHPYK